MAKRAKKAEQASDGVVRAEGFVVVDKEGRERAKLGMNEDGDVRLLLTGEDRQMAAVLAVRKDGTVGLGLFSESDEGNPDPKKNDVGIHLATNKDGVANLMITEKDGFGPSLILFREADGVVGMGLGPSFHIVRHAGDSDDTEIVLGNMPDRVPRMLIRSRMVTKENGEKAPSSTITMFDQHGSDRAAMFLTSYGRSQVWVQGPGKESPPGIILESEADGSSRLGLSGREGDNWDVMLAAFADGRAGVGIYDRWNGDELAGISKDSLGRVRLLASDQPATRQPRSAPPPEQPVEQAQPAEQQRAEQRPTRQRRRRQKG